MPTLVLLLASLAFTRPLGWRPAAPSLPTKTLDEGTFAITIAGKRAGQESFEISEYGEEIEIRTTTTLTVGSTVTAVRGTLRTDPAWRPLRGHIDTTVAGQTTRQTLQKMGDRVEVMKQVPGKPVVLTRPTKPVDFYVGTNMFALLTPICRVAGPKEQTLMAFPAAPLKLGPVVSRSFPQTKLGAPELGLAIVVADLARTTRLEIVCDGPKLVAVRQNGARLTAVRSSYEEVAAALEAKGRSKPPVPETLVELPRKVSAGSVSLGCTLLVPRTHGEMKKPGKGKKEEAPKPQIGPGGLAFTPEAPKPLPGVVFITGSGPQDRDEDSVGPGNLQLSLFKVMAIKLGEAGIASLRCDDRGTGESTGNFKKATLQHFVADTQATVAALRAEAAVDPDRVGLVGHSEGALVAPLVAARDARLRALALLASPGRPLDAIILEEGEATMKRFGVPEDDIRASLAEEKATYDAVRAGKALPKTLSPAERKATEESLPWLRSHFRHDPLAHASKVTGPAVLVAQGAQDVQISAKDAELVRDAFARGGNKRVTHKLYPELNYLFSASKTGSLADYSDPQSQVDMTFLNDVSGFLRDTLKK